MKKIYLYGAGTRCQTLYGLIREYYDEIRIVDGNPQKWNTKMNDEVIIHSPDILKKCNGDYVVITNLNEKNYINIYNRLKSEYNISDSQLLTYEELCWEALQKQTDNNLAILDAYCCQALGGIEAWVLDLARALKERGCNVRLLADDCQALVNDENREYTDIVGRSGAADAAERVENYLRLKQYLVSSLPCTIITNRCNVVTMAACDIKKEHGDKIKIISVIHNGTEGNYRRYALYSKYVDMYVGVAEGMIPQMIKRGISVNKMCSTTLPFECQPTINRAYTINGVMPLQIGYAGRLDRIKNDQKRIDLILEVIKRLINQSVNIHMNIAGDGFAKKELENILERENLKSYVTLYGRIDRSGIPDFWKKVDVGINMSDYEGHSISQLEMMANGTVPVFTDTSGTADDITSGYNGYIIPLGDVESAVRTITYIEKNREILPEMGKKAHDAVLPKSDWEKSYDFWQNLIES